MKISQAAYQEDEKIISLPFYAIDSYLKQLDYDNKT